MQNVREITASFEAVKIAWRQSKDGFVLTLSVHPDEVNPDIAICRTGTRFQVAMVEITDTGEPVAGPELAEGLKAVKVAATLCRDERFWQWLATAEGLFIESEAEAAEWLREEIGVRSRSELKDDAKARKRFEEVKDRFLEDFRLSR